MTSLSEYVDARDLHPDYTQVPCQYCAEPVRVHQSNQYTHHCCYCRADNPLPDHMLQDYGIVPDVAVRL